ncbi:hypothetical protein [Haloechinothrix salitolerans]|uniref:Uncharacterized protein n=1 Tax=Haloechinothrix salitolerans TaxID=926830 RepID=A0ABW2C7V1_9PSEU
MLGGVDLAAMTDDERFAAVSDAVKKIDVEMLAELVCIDLDIGPLPPSPRVDDEQ